MRRFTEEQKAEVIHHYRYLGKMLQDELIPHGHINDTILLTMEREDGTPFRLILQKINKYVFRNPEGLMENIRKVTEYMGKCIEERGGDPLRETLTLVPTNEGANYCVDSQGEYWRAYLFIEGTFTCQQFTPALFYEAGLAFGRFQRELAAFPAKELCETIPDFHDTKKRLDTFRRAVKEDVAGRAASVTSEIEEVLKREALAGCYEEAVRAGKVLLRVTHNDTKPNNVMLDEKTEKGVCVVDLDTVMPGFVMNDFGDAVRFGANTAAEDETDLEKVQFDVTMYEAFVRGFLEPLKDTLTKDEILLLPKGALLMTYENGMRFLTDYLQGDVYFKVEHETHNLDRFRSQFQLLSEMERQEREMEQIIKRYC